MSTNPPKIGRTSTADLRVATTPEDERTPVTRDDVDDLGVLPHAVRLLSGEIRDLTACVRLQVVPALGRLAEVAAEDRAYTDQQFARLQARLDELHAMIAGSR